MLTALLRCAVPTSPATMLCASSLSAPANSPLFCQIADAKSLSAPLEQGMLSGRFSCGAPAQMSVPHHPSSVVSSPPSQAEGNSPASTAADVTVHIVGVSRGSSEAELGAAIRRALEASFDFSRVQEGHRVALVAACNSKDAYPATAHPLGLRVLAEMLEARGATVSVIGQAGIEYVLHGPKGVVRGSSEECYIASGMAASGVPFEACEDEGWQGFDHVQDPRATHWKHGIYLSRLLNRTDHVAVVSRISTHAQAGVTLGIKNFVGLLRQDSRLDFHQHGPMPWFIGLQAIGSGLRPHHDPRHDFFEKIAEIPLSLKPKLLGELLVGTEVLTTMGPNAHLMTVGGLGVFRSHVVKPETGLVIASRDLVAADAVALAFLIQCSRQTPWLKRALQKLLMLANGQIKELGSEGVYENRMIRHALRVGLGMRAQALHTMDVPEELRMRLAAALELS